MRGELLMRFLDYVDEYGGGLSDYVIALGTAGPGASFHRLEYHQFLARSKRMQRMRTSGQFKKIEKQYYDLLYSATKDGLIRKTLRGDARFALTGKGARRQRTLHEASVSQMPRATYAAQVSHDSVAVSFDIPENKRKERAWLRSALKQMGFHMIQQSFWMGKRILPANFITDARAFGVAQYIEIFSVDKKGSLERFS